MKFWPRHAGTRRPWSLKLLWIPLLFGLVTHWDIALPRMNVHYSQAGRDELRYIWNVQDRIDKGGMLPGGGATDLAAPQPRRLMALARLTRACCSNASKYGSVV